MNKTDIRKRLAELEVLSNEGLNGSAHKSEDELYRDFVQAVAQSDHELAPLATLVLSSRNIIFNRYYMRG